MPYQPHKFHLDRVDFTLKLPRAGVTDETTLFVAGRSTYSRTHLWSYEERWSAVDPSRDLSPTDALHWIATAVWQDRPTVGYQLDRSLRGDPLWDQLQLPL